MKNKDYRTFAAWFRAKTRDKNYAFENLLKETNISRIRIYALLDA